MWSSPLPLHHVGGSVSTILAALSVGAAVALIPQYEPELVLDVFERAGATHAGLVPTMCLDLLASPTLTSRRLKLRRVMAGGSTVAPMIVRRIEEELGVRFVIGYGQSESANITQTALEDSAEDKGRTIGRPLPQREVRIIDPATGATASLAEAGELCVRSPLVMDRYLAMPEATAAAIDAEGWLRTGDLCSMDQRGVVTIHGRLRDVIIRGGENIYPREVEDALLAHPAVADVAVVGMPDERWGEQVAAFVRRVPGTPVTEGELVDFGRERLAAFEVPATWRFVNEFPLTASGKVKKFELQELMRS